MNGSKLALDSFTAAQGLPESNSVLQSLEGPPHYFKKLLTALSRLSKSWTFYTSIFTRALLN